MHALWILVVLRADVFQQLDAREQSRSKDRCEGTRVGSRVVDSHSVLECAEVHSRPAFDNVQLLRMWMADVVELGTVIETDGVDDQGIASPLDPGITEAQACPYGRALDSCATLLPLTDWAQFRK